MDDHFQIKKSQAFLVENVPVFIKNSKNEFVLYKSENIKLDSAKYHDDSLPDLFIRKTDKESALSEIQKALNIYPSEKNHTVKRKNHSTRCLSSKARF